MGKRACLQQWQSHQPPTTAPLHLIHRKENGKKRTSLVLEKMMMSLPSVPILIQTQNQVQTPPMNLALSKMSTLPTIHLQQSLRPLNVAPSATANSSMSQCPKKPTQSAKHAACVVTRMKNACHVTKSVCSASFVPAVPLPRNRESFRASVDRDIFRHVDMSIFRPTSSPLVFFQSAL